MRTLGSSLSLLQIDLMLPFELIADLHIGLHNSRALFLDDRLSAAVVLSPGHLALGEVSPKS